MKLIGPFRQVVTLANLPLRGSLRDEQLEVIECAGIVVNARSIIKVGNFEHLKQEFPHINIEYIEGEQIAMPAFTDCHTHICFGGNRANDFSLRNAGKTYLEIAESGGGIWSSVKHTRETSEADLLKDLLIRIDDLIRQGITTIEIKSGYGLKLDCELKMLRAINSAKEYTPAKLVPTCLAAHAHPKDFKGGSREYLNYVLEYILPVVQEEDLAKRVDIFIETSAFEPEDSRAFLQRAKAMGFHLTVHADQFTTGGSRIAVDCGAQSVDHLEATNEGDIRYIAQSNTVAVVLPGASLGLGMAFAPARKLLDAGAILAIGTDWNPGSAPMGKLIMQASVLATSQKLSTAEVLAGICFRAAYALGFEDRGVLTEGKRADFVCFKTDHYQNVLYRQGGLQPCAVFIKGQKYA
ncbi:imidazolonepropionase [Elizabethkingia argentiflava]|uniref:Imidazolonepropionase n=1 Tax=Elizabethkingia argenteiflava TaxID=2681556 RepID=A0A845PYY7_9FLAO|nr:imidazolonepropionase [Elizabethkingia argenteiflava]NAW51300.1 imidazolonepropionase [Elizabethkingia argenteiflava]